jgi:hypothetical protein
VLGYEAHRLIEVGRPDSVERICWVSDTEGDGLGYDIRSSSDGDDDRYIEVKTTNSGALTPFIISANELTFSKEAGSLFFLYRVFEYSSIPHLYMLQGDLEARLSLRPIDYRARLKAL